MIFEKLMENESYWDSINVDKILVENGDIEQKETVQVNVGPEDLYDIMSEHFIEVILENEKLIEDTIKVHAAKRYNRKYINARKHLIKDKKYIIRRVWAKSNSEMYKEELLSKNIISIDNEVSVRFVQKEKTTTVIPKFVDIKFNGYDFKDHIEGKFIVTEKEDRFILESIPSEDQYAWEPKKIVMKDNIFDIFMKDRKDLAFEKVTQRGFDYTQASYYLSGNTFFYGKPYENGFIGNININKFSHDYNGWISAKAMKIKKIKKALDILEKEGLNEWFQNERNDAFYINYFDWEDFEDENDYYCPSGIEGYIKPFLGMDKFYYDDNGSFDLLEKYEEDQYSNKDSDYYDDSYMYDDFWDYE